METEIDNSTKLAIMISALRDHSAFRPFITSVAVMKKDNQTCRKVSSLFIEKEKRLEDKTDYSPDQITNVTRYLAQMTGRVKPNRNTPSRKVVNSFFYCEKVGHMIRHCGLRKKRKTQ